MTEWELIMQWLYRTFPRCTFKLNRPAGGEWMVTITRQAP